MIRKDFECPEHGLFEADVDMDAEEAPCPALDEDSNFPSEDPVECLIASPWVPAPVRGKVRAVEAVRGGWSKPERSTFLDTRDLGEGQDIDDWRARRAELRHEQRKREVKETF